MHKRQIRKNRVPPRLGNSICGVWPYVLALIINLSLHIFLFFLYGRSHFVIVRLIISFIFFIYPFYYASDVLWSLRPSVCRILSGGTLINRKYYMNTPGTYPNSDEWMSVTVSIPVYTEENSVIFQTIKDSMAACRRYHEISGKDADILISDDGLAPLVGGLCTDNIVEALASNDYRDLNESDANRFKAAERIRFYRENGISFVARPSANRAGLFKKASNLNYTLKLGSALESGSDLNALTRKGGLFEGAYAEGKVQTNDIILMLDKDSGVPERIMEAIVPEFCADEELAYVQCSTDAVNLYDNYFSYAIGHQVNSLFHCTWPCKALQGYFVPLIGHNVFLRKKHLTETGLWSENKVSEDYDKAIALYTAGYHGKYAQIPGLEFTEYVSRAFSEETSKQHRYSYGLFEMLFDGTVVMGKSRGCDVFFMILYFFSNINAVMLIPTVLFECFFGNIHYLWAGFLLCSFLFIFLPALRGAVLRRSFSRERKENLLHAFIVAVSFVGHSFSMLSGALRYLANKIKPIRKAFPSTSVDNLQYWFISGLKMIGSFVKKNLLFLPISILCLDRGIFLLTRKGIDLPTVITYSYILFGVILTPVIMTPQLFLRPKNRNNRQNSVSKKK